MILTSPDELRLFLSSHTLQNLETMRGFIDNSEHDFLEQRIGTPLLKYLNEYYLRMYDNDHADPEDYDENIPSIESITEKDEHHRDTMELLLLASQRCVAFDAVYRAADIHAISFNEAGLNIAESKNYESSSDKVVDRYKSQLYKEAHAAANRLLILLETWQKEAAEEKNLQAAAEENGETYEIQDEERLKIVELWKQSEYYYFWDGLLFNTATEFNLFINIYDSREKFIQLLPDIRYCQEVYIESEVGTELLTDLITKRKNGTLSPTEDKAYKMLQRILALHVESRSSLLGQRKESRDEAAGNIRNFQKFMRKHQTEFSEEIIATTAYYIPEMWDVFDEENAAQQEQQKPEPPKPPRPIRQFDHAGRINDAPLDPRDPRFCHYPGSDGILDVPSIF